MMRIGVASFLCLVVVQLAAVVVRADHGGHETVIESYVYNNPSHSGLPAEEISRIVEELDAKMKGHVYPKGSSRYEFHRPVHNGACSHLYPLMIAVPESTEDVSQIILTAQKYNLETSVRSGGHSFVCQGIKQNSLHIDVSANSLLFGYLVAQRSKASVLVLDPKLDHCSIGTRIILYNAFEVVQVTTVLISKILAE